MMKDHGTLAKISIPKPNLGRAENMYVVKEKLIQGEQLKICILISGYVRCMERANGKLTLPYIK